MPAKTIDQYIKNFPKEHQVILQKLRQVIKGAIPKPSERISYGIPTFDYNGKYLVYFAAFKNHIGVYPAITDAVNKVKGLSAYKVSKGTLKFPLTKSIPFDKIRKFVEFRVKESTPSGKTLSHIHRHKDGTVWAKGELKDGKMHGYWEWYRKDGSKMRSGTFVNGKQKGKWTTYAANGRVVKVTNFK